MSCVQWSPNKEGARRTARRRTAAAGKVPRAEDAQRRYPPLLLSSPASACSSRGQGGQSRSLRPATQWRPQQSHEIRPCNLFKSRWLASLLQSLRLHSAASARWLKLANGTRNDHAAAHRPSSRVAAFATTFVLLSAIARSAAPPPPPVGSPLAPPPCASPLPPPPPLSPPPPPPPPSQPPPVLPPPTLPDWWQIAKSETPLTRRDRQARRLGLSHCRHHRHHRHCRQRPSHRRRLSIATSIA